MRLVQFRSVSGDRAVAATGKDGQARLVNGIETTRDLALAAIAAGRGLEAEVAARGLGAPVDLIDLATDGRLLAPLDHPDAAHCYVTGTGLTHLGSAEGRDKMHKDLSDPSKQTDSMKMFKMGVENGKPAAGETGVQPEWFYKGDGSMVVAPGAALPSPSFALDGSEEPEIVGLYIVGPDGQPYRLGFALGNEFSDHVTERQNYLYLAHSKLRHCAVGPELLIGALPDSVVGTSRIHRGAEVLWEKPFLSGEANMSHSIANLEAHHFKYGLFRRPGDIHLHYFGTATLSFSDGIKTVAGDTFEISVPDFGLPLRNTLAIVPAPKGGVKSL